MPLQPDAITIADECAATTASARHLISLADLSAVEMRRVVDRSVSFASGAVPRDTSLTGKVVGLDFRQPSTRTRTAFAVAALRLGASTVTYGPGDLQVSTGETPADTARVLAGYLDALVIRTGDRVDELHAMAAQPEMAIINALTDNEHPTQALADLSTLTEHFGVVDGLKVVYVGQGNNTAAALALALARFPRTRMTLISPAGYGLPPAILHAAQGLANAHGSEIQQHHSFDAVTSQADVVYATRWRSLGTRKFDDDWPTQFAPFKITHALLRALASSARTVLMHDLPAVRGEELDDDLLDAPQCIAFRQARHKLFSAMAILEWSLAARTRGRRADAEN